MNLPPVLRQRYFSSNGTPLVGGKLYSYQAGTSTPQATYTDQTGATPNANPIILDANGEASMWLDQTLSYKFVLQDSSGVTQWTADNIIGILTANAVGTGSIQDGSVTSSKLAAGAVNAAALASDASVDANRPVNTNNVRDGAITRAKLASGTIGTDTYTASKTANYTATNADDVVLCNAGAGAFTVTLYTAVGNSGRKIRIIKTDSTTNVLTVNTTSSQTINGALTRTLGAVNDSLLLESDGTNWGVISSRTSAEVSVTTPNGYGSTNGFVRLFSAIDVNVGGAMTLANDASLGTSVTVNEDGIYSVSYTWDYCSTGSTTIAVTKNSTHLSVLPLVSEAIASFDTPAANIANGVSRTLSLKAGDVIRPQAGISSPAPNSTNARTRFSMVKVS